MKLNCGDGTPFRINDASVNDRRNFPGPLDCWQLCSPVCHRVQGLLLDSIAWSCWRLSTGIFEKFCRSRRTERSFRRLRFLESGSTCSVCLIAQTLSIWQFELCRIECRVSGRNSGISQVRTKCIRKITHTRSAAICLRLLRHLPTTAHVAGAMMIFGSIAQLFRHLLYLLMRFSDDESWLRACFWRRG